MKRPKIIQVVREIGNGGGVSGVAYNLEKEFLKLGYQCQRLTLKDVITKHKNNSSNFLQKKINLLIDVFIFSIFGSIKLKKFRTNYVSIIHNDVVGGDIYINHGLHKAMWSKNKNKWKMLFRNPLHIFLLIREELRYRFKLYNKIITFSNNDKEEMIKYYPMIDKKKIIIIPNGVDINKFKPDKKVRLAIRNQYKVENKFIMIFIGHEFDRKGLEFVIKSLEFLPKEVILWVIGGNDKLISKYKKLLNSFTKNRVKFFGVQYNIEKYLNASDILILPTYAEAWPLVILEAMACGKPVLATPVNGIPECLIDKQNGLFIKRDSLDIASKVEMLMKNSNFFQNLCENARKTALNFSWENVAKKYINIIEEIWKEKQKNV